jgi:hypothetical protein
MRKSYPIAALPVWMLGSMYRVTLPGQRRQIQHNLPRPVERDEAVGLQVFVIGAVRPEKELREGDALSNRVDDPVRRDATAGGA